MPIQTLLQPCLGGVCAPKCFEASALSAGIKNPQLTRLDFGLLYSKRPAVSAGVFTTNRVKAAPVRLSQNYLKTNNAQAVLVNSGNANACTGVEGLSDARSLAKQLSKELGIRQREVAICSTGVIGLPLPMERMTPHIPSLCKTLCSSHGQHLADAILTSDTRRKECAFSLMIGEHEVRFGACAKGAGMIAPSMATMLCFITTDAHIEKECLHKSLLCGVEKSFNRITIDGDMSTNDSVILLANGASGMPLIKRNSRECTLFNQALEYIMLQMAKAIVSDGERVTKFVTLKVKGARSYLDARKVAESVANSSLVKSSWNGNDPNWGRIIHAVGYSRAAVREELIDIFIEDQAACLGGMRSSTPPDILKKIVERPSFTITIDLHRGEGHYTIYTSDLSPEYVDFNRSEYAYWKQNRHE